MSEMAAIQQLNEAYLTSILQPYDARVPESELHQLTHDSVALDGEQIGFGVNFAGMLGRLGLEGGFRHVPDRPSPLLLNNDRRSVWSGDFSDSTTNEVNTLHIFTEQPGRVARRIARLMHREPRGRLGALLVKC